jgi:hypothetical protein
MYSLALIINIGPYGKNVSKRFFSETTWTIETKLPRNDYWKDLYKVSVFYADRNFTLEGPLQSVCFICQSEIQDGHHHNT